MRGLLTLGLVLSGICGHQPAWAYIPPSGYLVQNWVKRHQEPKTLRIRTTVIAIENDRPVEGAVLKVTTWYEASTQKLRARAVNAAGEEIFAQERDLSLQNWQSVPVAAQLLFQAHPNALAKSLLKAEIPIVTDDLLDAALTAEERQKLEKSYIGRLDGRIGWVFSNNLKPGRRDPLTGLQIVGEGASAVPSDASMTAELWWEKDGFAPMRLFYGTPKLDVRMERFQNFRNFSFPRGIALKRGGKTFLREELGETLINPTGAASVEKELKGGHGGGLTPAGEQAPDSLKQLARQYFEYLR